MIQMTLAKPVMSGFLARSRSESNLTGNVRLNVGTIR